VCFTSYETSRNCYIRTSQTNLIIYKPQRLAALVFSATHSRFIFFFFFTSVSDPKPNSDYCKVRKMDRDSATRNRFPAAPAKLSSSFPKVYRKLNDALMISRFPCAVYLWCIYGSYVSSSGNMSVHATYIRRRNCAEFRLFSHPYSHFCMRR